MECKKIKVVLELPNIEKQQEKIDIALGFEQNLTSIFKTLAIHLELNIFDFEWLGLNKIGCEVDLKKKQIKLLKKLNIKVYE